MIELVNYILMALVPFLGFAIDSDSQKQDNSAQILAASVRGVSTIEVAEKPVTTKYSSELISILSQSEGITTLSECELTEWNQPKEDAQKKIKAATKKPTKRKSIAEANRPSAVVKNYEPKEEKTSNAPSQVLSDANVIINAADYAYEWGKSMLRSRKYHPGRGVTYCNTFTVDLTNRILGIESPFGDNWTNWLVDNGKAGRAHHMHEYCMEKAADGEYFEEITGETLNDRFKKAWEATREGKLVIFTSPQRAKKGKRTEPGHFAVAVPTEETDFRVSRDSKGNEYFVGKVVQAGRSILDGDKKINGKGGHSYLSAAWRADHFEGIKILVCKGTGTP